MKIEIFFARWTLVVGTHSLICSRTVPGCGWQAEAVARDGWEYP